MGLFAVVLQPALDRSATGRERPGGRPDECRRSCRRPDQRRLRLARPVGRGGPADALDVHPGHALRPADVIRFLQSLTLRFGGDVWWLSYVLIRDALLVITLGLGMLFFMPNLYFVARACRSRRRSPCWSCSGRSCVKIVRDPDEDPAAFRLLSVLLVIASVLYIVPQVYGMEAADQAYLGDLPSKLISSANLDVGPADLLAELRALRRSAPARCSSGPSSSSSAPGPAATDESESVA